ncbi:MAG TPA: L,D-transpeptidase family protein [Vicinamibacteria bacterium]|jgi:L,D-peptidoglycan transpeptidase YkuD (ErfK/YbiS/YcfS/YnhG family)|nr:L,D-transpeptidase family protein [Vicinamibacteria bacterium]
MILLIAVLAAAPVPAESRQLVLSVGASWTALSARVRLFDRENAAANWRPLGDSFDASLGRTGLAWGRGLHPSGLEGPSKKEGDGKSPAGVFELREATGYAPEPPPGTRLAYRTATPDLRCVDDPSSSFYNRLVNETRVRKDWASAEMMHRGDDLYRLVIWVGHNDGPPAAGAGSCIFLHLRSSPGSVTEGCTAMGGEPMERLLRWLDPALRPVLVQIPATLWPRLAREWGLPPPAQGVGDAAER